ncbi:MAG: DUF11 domain-containing protein [Geobacteraceae bacterium]|nr:DUF11 domain-containing protein [Geobacteraceae bacterium]
MKKNIRLKEYCLEWMNQHLLWTIFTSLMLLAGFSIPCQSYAATSITPQFSPATVYPGDTSKFRFTIGNTSTDQLTSAKVTQVLPSSITIKSPANITNTCGFTVNAATPGSSLIYLTNGTVPAHVGITDGQCYFEIDVSSTTNGNQIASFPKNTTPTSSSSGYTAKDNGVDVWDPSDSSATLAVNPMSNPTVSKSCSPTVVGDPSTLTITLNNPNTGANLPITTFTDNLPTGMVVAPTPNASTTCSGGSVTASAGSGSVTLTGGTIGINSSCSISVKVLVSTITGTSQTFTNSLSSGAIVNSRGLTSPAYSASWLFTTPLSVSKSFGTTTISAAQPSLMTIAINNASTTSAQTISSFSDNLTGTTFKVLNTSSSPVAAPADPSVTCTGTGSVNGTLTAPVDLLNQTISLSGATMGPSGSCTITAYLTSSVDGYHTNTISSNAVVNTNNYATAGASAGLQANAQLTAYKYVSVRNVAPGQWTEFTVDIYNWATSSVNSVSFKDVLPLNGGNQMTLYNPYGSFYTRSGACSGGSWYGTNAAGVSTGAAPTASDAGIFWTGGTINYGNGSSAVCTITFWAKQPVGATSGMSFNNNIATNSITSVLSSDGVTQRTNTNSSSASTTYIDKIGVNKSFSPAIIPQNGLSTLSITLYNRVVYNSITGISLTDNLPSGVTLAANPAASNSCGGSLQAFPGDNKLILSNGTLARRPDASQETSCTITVNVTGPTLGSYVNTIHPSDLTDTQGLTIPANVSATLDISSGLTGSKSFTPSAIISGGTSRVKITVTNSASRRLTNISVNDNSFASGLIIANPANAATNCPDYPFMVVNPGTGSAALYGVTLDSGKSCDFSFNVTTTGSGSKVNTIPAGNISSAEGLNNTADVTATLYEVPTQININKSFNPVLVSGGYPSIMQLDITNPSNSVTITGVSITDTFPEGMEVYSVPNASTTCSGGTVSAIPGDGKIVVNGATLAKNSTCYVYVSVTSKRFLNLTNTIPAGSVSSDQGYTNPEQTKASLSTMQSLGISKRFTPAYVTAGTVSTLKLDLVSTLDANAPEPVTLTGVAFSDNLPSGVVVAATPNAAMTCNGGSTPGTVTANALATSISLSGTTLKPGTSCQISVDVVAASNGTYTNTIAESSLSSDQLVSNNDSASATLHVMNLPTISKAFGNSKVNPDQSNSLTITINNNYSGSVALTGVALTDVFPGGLAIDSNANASTTCSQGLVTANPGERSISISGANIPANSSCAFSANLVSGTSGTYINNIGPGSLVTDQGVTNSGTTTDTMSVNQPPTISKSFSPASILANGTSTLTILLGNSNSSAITLSSELVDALPGNLFVASTPNIGGTCTTGSVTATAGATSITYANGASIPSGGCTITVDVTTSLNGTYTNTIAASQLSTSTGVNQNAAVAVLAVGSGALAPPTMTKSFSPGSILINGTSTLTINLGNPNSGALALSSTFTDTLPSSVVVAATPNKGGTCTQGSITATAGAGSISYASGATIPSGGCTIMVDVTSSSAGSYTNSLATSALVTNGGSPVLPAVAGLVVQSLIPPTVIKSFNPVTINPGGTSILTITLGNSNASALTLSSLLTDTLPTHVTVATTPNVRGTCTGTVTASGGGSTVTYANGASIPAGGCTIIVDVTSSTPGGPYTNTIAANALQTATAGNNTGAATANLFVNPYQPPSINKSFSVASIAAGGTARLTLSLGNNNLSDTTLTSDLVDNLPTNLKVAATPNIQKTCTGTVTATANSTSITYASGATIPAGGCAISVDVTSTVGHVYTNSIAIGALVTGYGSNEVGTSANLKVKEPPTLAKSFSPANMEKNTTSTLTLTLGNPNDYSTALTSTLTDTLPTNIVIANPPSVGGTCSGTKSATAGGSTITYANGASIPAGGCTITVNVTSGTIGPYTNTITANSLQTDVGNYASSATADLYVYERPTVSKGFLPTEIATGGTSTLTITFGNTNPGATTLSSTFTDTMPSNLVVKSPANVGGTCTTGSVTATPGQRTVSYANGASIPSGGCTITVEVTSASGANYTNTVAAGGLQTTFGSNASQATADIKVKAPPTVAKSFASSAVNPNTAIALTITLGNPNANYSITLSSSFTDTLPTNLLLASNPNKRGTCTTGSVTASGGGSTVTYASGASIPAGGCTIIVDVLSATMGVYTNTIDTGALVTDTGSNASPASADLTVRERPTVSKNFSPNEIAIGGTSTLTIMLGNTNPVSLTLSSNMNDNLPTNLVVASTPNVRGTCTTGSVTATAGTSLVRYASGATIPSGGCTIIVDVTSSTGYLYTNTISSGALNTGSIYSTNASSASANLKVKAPPTISKSFSPIQIVPGSTSVLTLTLGNPNGNYAITLSSALTDTLPANLVLASSPNKRGTCTVGSITANGGASSITYASGASVPAGGCTIIVDVSSSTLAVYTNTIAANAFQTDTGNNASLATADLTVRNLPTVTKVFSPASIVKGASGVSTLTLHLGDGNPVALMLSSVFTDTLPTGMTVASSPNITKTCPGTVTAAASSNTITYASGATIPAGGCTISVNVTVATSLGTIFTNTIAANALQTNYGNNTDPTSATLKIKDPPTISKSFSPTSILVVNGGNSTLTLNLGNPNTYSITLTSDLVDNFPSGLVLGTPATVGGTCNTGSVQATAGGTSVTYVSGATVPSGGCTITVPVTAASGATPGSYLNDLNGYLFTTDVGNATRATADLLLTPVADIKVEKRVSPLPTTLVSFGSNVTFTVTATNLGPSTATNVWISDLLPLGYTFVSATPSQGSSSRTVNYDGTSSLYWSVGDLARDAAPTMEVVATVLTYGGYTNTASVFKTDAYDPVSSNNTATATPLLPRLLACDVNRDQQINITDINLITAAKGLGGSPLDPRNLDGDAFITINDARGCTLRCDYPNCVVFPRGTQGVAFSARFAPTGGTDPNAYTITSGSLPGGLYLNGDTGALSGTPTATGTFPVTVRATDASSGDISRGYTIYIDSPLTITTASLPNGTRSVSYNQALAKSGGLSSYQWSIVSGTLPTGLTVAKSTGIISGTPTVSGTFNFTVKLLDYYSRSVTKDLSITIP